MSEAQVIIQDVGTATILQSDALAFDTVVDPAREAQIIAPDPGTALLLLPEPPLVHFLIAAERGLPGASGGAEYTHNQPTPASTWTVNHNLGFRPDVSLTNSGGEEVRADVLHISNNQCQIDFVTPIAGIARMS